MTHIYAFGSICRGDFDCDSDVDLLAITDHFDSRFSPEIFSIYSYQRLQELWSEGNPFAWHLSTESKLLFAENSQDFLETLGQPQSYKNRRIDCHKFCNLFQSAWNSVLGNRQSLVFDLGTMFLAIRNYATCFSLGVGNIPNFSRNSALCLGSKSAPISQRTFSVLLRSRILSTRGHGEAPTRIEVDSVMHEAPLILTWMFKLLEEIDHERIQQSN
jgi:hypothetical protein